MYSRILPSIRWRRQNQMEGAPAHSLVISLMRGLAALQVAAAHLRSELFPGLREIADPPLAYQALALATAFAHPAVVVFFLISGWLVGGSLLNRLGDAHALRGYAIDRVTRLWTVLLPALFLMLAIGVYTMDADPARPDFAPANPYSAAAFAGNLAGLQTVLVEPFGGNYALWSLANETWYYIQFPLLLLVFSGHGRLRRLGAATLLVLTVAALPSAITVYFALWLLGALFSRLRIDCGPAWRILLLLAAAGTLLRLRLTGGGGDLAPANVVQHLSYSLPLLAFLAAMQRPLSIQGAAMRALARAARLLAEFSFTLYVLHVPMIKLLRHIGMREFGRSRLSPTVPLDYAIYAGMLLVLVAGAYLCYLLFESHTFRIRRAVKALLQRPAERPALPSASMNR